MTSAIVASLTALLALGMVEALGRFYPARETWWRLRRRHGRRAVWAMRARIEATAERRTARFLAAILFGLVVGWMAAASLLDKRWYEVALDVVPYVIVSIGLLRFPPALREVAARMKRYEEDAGDDPLRDLEQGNGDATAVAL